MDITNEAEHAKNDREINIDVTIGEKNSHVNKPRA